MGRAPCCEKMGLKKGPWSYEEDQILISYIRKHGHANWRSLPKQAGLLRCGKSCRLRWINYLRPDIKRGNFTNEEEETIIKLHEMLGNRWSAIAAKLSGRTDNEIKNVWHTTLKKRLLKTNQLTNSDTKTVSKSNIKQSDSNYSTSLTLSSLEPATSSDLSSDTFSHEQNNMDNNIYGNSEDIESLETMPEIDSSFWSEESTMDNNEKPTMPSNSWTIVSNELPHQYSSNSEKTFQQSFGYASHFDDDGMDFWYDVFIRSEESMELPDF